MKKTRLIIDKLPQTRLFGGITGDDLPNMLKCMNAVVAKYDAGETVLLAGDPARLIGLVCSGEVRIIRDDIFGNRTIQSILQPGDIFGLAFVCASVERVPVSAIAVKESEIMLIDYRRILETCPSSCAFHGRLIENMLGILAEKNLMLDRKMETLTARTTRAKLMAYLSSLAESAGSARFRIPFNRQELADYIAVDRSAMSAELGRMRDDGLLRFERNEFELLRAEHANNGRKR